MNFSSLERLPFYSKICVLKQPLTCYRNDLITSTVSVGIPFEPLQIVFWGLSHSIKGEKIGQTFCHREDSLFLKNLVIEVLGPEETILMPAENLAKYLVSPFKLFPDVFHVRQYEKKAANFFLLKRLPLFQKLVFSNNFLGVTEVI